MRRGGLVMALLLSVGINLGLVLSALLATARSSDSPAAAHSRPPLEGARLPRLADELALEGETRQRFITRHQRYFNEARQPRERLRELRAALSRELFAEPMDEARVDDLVKRISEELALFEQLTVGLVLDVRSLLPADRQATYRRFVERLRAGGSGTARPPAEGARVQ